MVLLKVGMMVELLAFLTAGMKEDELVDAKAAKMAV